MTRDHDPLCPFGAFDVVAFPLDERDPCQCRLIARVVARCAALEAERRNPQ